MTYPKQLFTTKKENTNLSGICNAVSIFKDTRMDLDMIVSYELTGFYHSVVSPEVKCNFRYDYMMGSVKNTYNDQFNRIVNVRKLPNIEI